MTRANKQVKKTVQAFGEQKKVLEADQIVAYLQTKDVDLPEALKTKLERYEFIRDLRGKFSRNSDIIPMVRTKFGISKTQAYKDIHEMEYIFGKSEKSNKDFERAFLLECSRKNIQIAFNSKNTEVITKALLAHAKISGVDTDDGDLPDYSKLEQHNYYINLPDQYIQIIQQLGGSGAVNLDRLIPNKPNASGE